jgi:hypothetical protein
VEAASHGQQILLDGFDDAYELTIIARRDKRLREQADEEAREDELVANMLIPAQANKRRRVDFVEVDV